MSKNCLLCGKALSRIRVGGGEDFCTREHRNQYRLRQGMDRLTEANKVASVMRRRENPRPLVTLPVSNQAAPRTPDITIVIKAPRRKPVLPSSLPKLETRALEMGDVRGTLLGAASGVALPRSFSLLRWRVERLRRPGSIPTLRLVHATTVLLNRVGVVPPANPRAQKGRALRVSPSVAFPPPKRRASRLRDSEAILRGRLIWNDTTRPAEKRDIAASPRVLRPQPKTFGPISQITEYVFRFGTDSPLALGGRSPRQMSLSAFDIDAQPMQFPVPAAVRNRYPGFQPFVIRRSPQARNPAIIVVQPAAVTTGHRVTSVPFAPQDSYATTFAQEQESK